LAIFAVVMTTDACMIWIALAVVLAAGELAWPSFSFAPCAAAAVLGAAAQWAGLGIVAAFVAFVMSCGLLLSFVRLLARRHLYTPQASRTGAAALIGRTAMVTEHVDTLQPQRCLAS
jgi:membrane protein implicated in regulation of membrane protease activity